MTAYRVGQRVRIEVEGTVLVVDGALQVRSDVDGESWYFKAPTEGVRVTVLAEPRPDEPTGLGAVVEDVYGGLWVRADHGDDRCWREVLPGTYTEDDACRRGWDHVSAVRVLAEGWTP